MKKCKNKNFSIVIAGYDTSVIEEFNLNFEKLSFLKTYGFSKPEMMGFPIGSVNQRIAPVRLVTKNNHGLNIVVDFAQKKLVLAQENYLSESFNYNERLSEILIKLLDLSIPIKISALGLNFQEDEIKNSRLCLFNSNIEQQLTKELWDTNIGFKSEIIFDKKTYKMTYRIYKNDTLELQEPEQRCYTIDSNFNFDLKDVDNKLSKISEIMSNIETYYNEYLKVKRNIVDLK